MAEHNVPSATPEERALRPRLIVLSAESELDCRNLAQSIENHVIERRELVHADALLDELSRRLSQMPVFEYRVAFLAYALDDLVERLQNLEQTPILPRCKKNGAGLAFVFSGQGGQHPQMSQELLDVCPVYAKSIARASKFLKTIGCPWDMLTEITKHPEISQIDEPEFSYPTTIAVQIALVDTFAELGVHPAFVLGHSSGELAAAYSAKALSFEDALTVAYHTGRLTSEMKRKRRELPGGMLAVGASFDVVNTLLQTATKAATTGKIKIACINSPKSVTVSGDEAAILDLQRKLEARGIFNQNLHTGGAAYHSHLMTQIATELSQKLEGIRGGQTDASITMISSLTGEETGETMLGKDYWVENLISPVQFMDATKTLCREIPGSARVDMLLELGPHSQLDKPIKQTLHQLFDESDPEITCTGVLKRGLDAEACLLDALRSLFLEGVSVSPQLAIPATDARPLPALPDYLFDASNISAQHVGISATDEEVSRVSQNSWKPACLQPDRKGRVMSRLLTGQSKGQAPKTDTERILHRIMCNVFDLNDEAVDIESNFFSLGGDSVLAVEVSSVARQEGLLLPVSEILRHPRLTDMSRVAEAFVNEDDITIDPFSLVDVDALELLAEITRDWAVKASEVEDVYPCTPLQEGLMVITQTAPRTYTYQHVYRLSPTVDVGRFCRAWENTVKNTAILRTTIIPTQSAGTCQVVTTREIEWQFPTDLQKYLSSDLEKGVVYGGPLARYALFKGADGATRFIWTAHHSLYDGWSRPLIWQTVQRHYDSDDDLVLGSLPDVPFNRFIRHIQTADGVLVDEFWKQKLSGSTPSRFPQKFPMGYQPQVNETFVRQCQASSRDGSGVTRSTLIQAAWAILMNEYHEGCNDVIYGLTTSGRNANVPGIGEMMAPTITTVPFRVRIDPDESVDTFLHRIQIQAIDMIPFEQAGLQNISKINHECRLACDFQHLLVIQPEQKSSNEEVLPGVASMQATELHGYPLTVQCIIGAENVKIQIEFDNSLITTFQVEHICAQFETVLAQLCKDRSRSVGEIHAISELDMKQLLDWNREFPRVETRTVTALVEAQVREQPHAPAICSWDGDFTYEELDKLSTRLAHHLIGLGIGPEDFVPYCFPKSAMTIVAMVAIMKAGGAGVPLDPEYPPERTMSIVSDAGATVVITTPDLSIKFKGTGPQVVSLSEDFLSSLTQEDSIVPHRAQSWNSLYIPFTSGSSGKSKAIVVEHSMFASSALAHAKLLGLGAHSRVFQFAAYTFDVNFADIFTSLIQGSCICIPSDFERLNDITGAINRMVANSAVLTPTVAAMFTPDQVPTLKTLILGGEPLTRENVQVWADRVSLFTTYGPAECCVYCTALPLQSPEDDPAVLGHALGSLNWVVNPSDHNKLSPVGCIGELVVQGPIVSRGYLNDHEKTEAAYISNPAWLPIGCAEKHQRVYKTGDLVRYNADGTTSFIGRKDTQVKVHGQRVELEEIESHLSHIPEIKHALMVVPGSGLYSGRLVCVLSLHGAMQTTSSRISDEIELIDGRWKAAAVELVARTRNALEQKLPRYMIPAAWAVVKKIPMNASRKLDRKLLKFWLEAIDESTYRSIADVSNIKATKQPATLLEKAICDTISIVLALPVDSIGLEHSFLGLGGDSISAMQLMSRLRTTHNVRLSVQDILRYRTVEALVSHAHISQNMEDDALVFEDIIGWFDLTPIQKMFFQKQPNGQNHFNQSFALKIARKNSPDPEDGQKDIVPWSALEQALRTLIERHPMLRCRYSKSQKDGMWRQRITTDAAESLLLIPSQRLSYHDLAGTFRGLQTQLNAEKGPLVAGMICHVDADQYLFLTIHHLVIDLVSWRVILEELEELLLHGAIHSEPGISYANWAKLQTQYAQSNLSPEDVLQADALSPDFEYWGMAKQPNIVADSIETSFVLDNERTSLLLGESQEALGTQPVEVMVAALVHSFHTVFQDRQIPAVFMEGHGRESWSPAIDITRTVGWFTTMYPVSVEIENSSDWFQTVKKTKDARRRLAHNGWSYFTARHLNPEASQLVETSDMEILFNYLGLYQQFQRPDSLFQPSGIAGQALQDFSPTMERYALFEISAAVDNGCLQFTFAVNKSMQHQSDIQRWVKECHRVLADGIDQLTEHPHVATVGDFNTMLETTSGIRRLTEEILPAVNISDIGQVERVSSCSSMQLGILLGQMKSPGAYQFYTIQEAEWRGDSEIDASMLLKAWQEVVDRHAALRTIFIRESDSDTLWGQLVLKQTRASVYEVPCSNEDPISTLRHTKPMRTIEGVPHHQLTFCCGTDGRRFFKLELSHALVDGTSTQIILKDIKLAFEGQLYQIAPPLSYCDYVTFLQQQRKRTSLEYWKTYLQDVQPCHFPLLDDGRPQIHQWETIVMEVPSVTEAVVRQFSNEYGLTFANVVQVAWAIVLQTFTNTDCVTYGYLTSGRDAPLEGIENAVGAFINMLVLKADLSKSTTALEVLQRCQDDYLRCIPHQYVSLGEIQHAIGMSGQPLSNPLSKPLFNTAISIQKRASHSGSAKLSLTSVHEYDPSEFDISVNVLSSARRTEFHLTHQTSKISSGQALSIASVFRTVISSILAAPEKLVSEVNVMSAESKHHIQRWTSQVPQRINSCMHHVISEQARNTPDAPALHSWEGDYTYAELESASDLLARYLAIYGIKPDDCIPLCFEKSLYTVIAVLAVLKTGGAFVLLDPKHPADRTKGLLENLNARFIIASEGTREYCETLIEEVVTFSQATLAMLPNGDDIELPTSSVVTPQNIMYVQFTSGSSGVPKGVVIEHSAACSSVHHHGSVMGFGPKTRTFQFSSYTFDAVILEIFTTLYHGGCICIPSDDDRMSRMTDSMRLMNVNMMFTTPTLAQLFKPEDVPMLKTLMVGGELVGSSTTDIWRDKVNLIGAYGPAECTIYSAYNLLSTNDLRPEVLGYPVGSVIWLVDPNNHDKLVPVGALGELLVQGPIVGRGYLHDAQRTEASFLTNTAWLSDYDGSSQHRLYKTGDLGRQNSDGTITIVGRKDTQFKVNGQRIEFTEIEYHIKANLPGVLQVAADVVTPTHLGGRPLLSVFINLGQSESRDENAIGSLLPMTESTHATMVEIESVLAKALPPYMIPRLWLPISRMPLSASGKTERKLLRSWSASLSEAQVNQYALSSGSKTEPSTDMERSLAQLWQRVLNISSVGRGDSFFRLGGDSISAMQLASAAHKAGVQLSVADIFNHPSLLMMAANLSTAQTQETIVKSEAVVPFGLLTPGVNHSLFLNSAAEKADIRLDWIQDMYPCTPLQEGMMALTTRDPGSYGWQDVLSLPASINLDRFRAAWQAVVNELEIIRTRLVEMDHHGTYQVVIKPQHSSIEWRYVDCLEEYLIHDKKLPFSYGTPLYRLAIVRQGSKVYCVSSAHHAILDRWSISLMMDRLKSHYLSQTLPPPPPFQTFIKWMCSLDPEASDRYWKSRFAGSSIVEFPRLLAGHRPRATAVAKHIIPKSATRGSVNITIPTLLRAAWAFTISQHTGADDVVFGMTQTGRNAPVADITDIVAPLITVVPFKSVIGKNLLVSELLQNIHQDTVAMIPHEHSGLQHIAQLNAQCQAASKFQNLLVIQSQQHQQDQAKLPLGLERLDVVENDVLSYGIILVCDLTEGAIMLQAAFDPKVVSHTMMETLLAQFGHFFQQLNDPENAFMSLQDLRLVGEHDMGQLSVWNRPRSAERVDKRAHDLIHERALAQPDSVAIDSEDGQFTYAQLDNLSTNLAHHLLECHQVGPEKVIPLFFRKSAWAIVSMLAVTKAGGAFVFLDPAHPMDRLMFITRQIKATSILTTPDLSSAWDSTALKPLPITRDFVEQLPTQQQLPVTSVMPHNVLYVIFTSGSTGTPKGCVVSHASFLSGAVQHARQSRLSSDARVLQIAPYTFDVSILETLTGLISGACICLPMASHQNILISQIINDLGITWSFLTPSVARTISPKNCPTLQTLILGGESLSKVDIETWAGQVHLCNGYGPSECAVACTANVNITADTDPANIGSTMCCNAWVVDSENPDHLLPIGAIGELLIQGPVVCRGYLNEPEKTDAVFIQPPAWLDRFGPEFSSENRLYLTGDLVRYNDDGTLHFIGRKDTQVKLRGQRIELGEIEHHASVYPSIRHVAVELPKSGKYRESLVAVLSLRGKAAPSSDELGDDLVPVSGEQLEAARQSIPDIRSYLTQHLPPYMVPSSFVVLEGLPLLSSGKINRTKIRTWLGDMSADMQERVSAQLDTSTSHTASLIPDDQITALILSKKITQLIAKDDEKYSMTIRDRDIALARAGLNSISAVSLAAFIKKEFDIRVSIDSLLEESMTVCDVARMINCSGLDPTASEAPSALDLSAEIEKALAYFDQKATPGPLHISQSPETQSIATILLTGATGFLGSQILKHLLDLPGIKRVVTLVRAPDISQATSRVIESAQKSKWWRDSYSSKLEVWIGDLSQPDLGLKPDQWRCIEGQPESPFSVDAIVHNGATVHWGYDYQGLEAVNVTSTVSLLASLTRSPQPPRFTFISGGQLFLGDENDNSQVDAYAQMMRTAGGYAQTKFVAEEAVKEFARRYTTSIASIASIVKPGLIVGTADSGVSNTDDFLWRVVASVIETGAFNSTGLDGIILVSGAHQVSTAILGDVLHPKPPGHRVETTIRYGIPVGELWEMLRDEFGYQLGAADATEWLSLLRAQVEKNGEKHPLWPVFHLLEATGGSLGVPLPADLRQDEHNDEVKASLRRSIVYLREIGYLPNADATGDQSSMQKDLVFARAGGRSRT
ncbi:hypothetical protein N7541_008462 [Penicillium brevicompactum]|uniref:Carrier domain-containing protein n=1 Tax=Penicillium brevicompactum TaxID=5074 RepID=A0A9W9QZ66_PENBR|nr:hypothetical protein N7541_008462 [Penicillium brevicompactum]